MARATDSSERRLAGSKRGAETVREAFNEVLTRKRYCELVGIHKTTLRRWEREGVVVPTSVQVHGIETNVFSQDDVEFGRQLSTLVREQAGFLSLAQAAESIRDSGR